jgi:hypothetical protein
MSMTLTLALLAFALGLMVFAGWRGGRPLDLTKGPRMVPWRFIMMLSGATAALLLIHIVTLMGVARPR